MTVFFNASLDEFQLNELSRELMLVSGVEDAVVVSDGVEYLKVSSKQFDDRDLEQLKQRFA